MSLFFCIEGKIDGVSLIVSWLFYNVSFFINEFSFYIIKFVFKFIVDKSMFGFFLMLVEFCDLMKEIW